MTRDGHQIFKKFFRDSPKPAWLLGVSNFVLFMNIGGWTTFLKNIFIQFINKNKIAVQQLYKIFK